MDDRITLASLLSLLLVMPGPDTSEAAEGPSAIAREKIKAARLLALHTDDAASFAIYRDSGRKEKLTLRREPVYRWTNPTRVGGQVGDVFLWTYRGRPEVVASIFSHPETGNRRVVCHELHSLSLETLVIDRPGPNTWIPQSAGVDLTPVPDAPVPASSAALRFVQLRSLAREFSGKAVSDRNQTWELRLLPQPIYRYESTDPAVIDGAVFALVSSAGTDPEIVLLLEARNTADGPAWLFGAARFSDMSLWLKHKDREVWNAIRNAENTFYNDAKHRFRFYQDRTIPEIEIEIDGARSDAPEKPGTAHVSPPDETKTAARP